MDWNKRRGNRQSVEPGSSLLSHWTCYNRELVIMGSFFYKTVCYD